MRLIVALLTLPLAAERLATKIGDTTIQAEFLIHSFSGQGATYFTGDYLVVDVEVSPPKGASEMISHSQFQLRLNGKRYLLPQAPAFVAASLKYPDWERRPGLVAQAGPVIIGRPQPVGRFPGDPRPAQDRLPAPPSTGIEPIRPEASAPPAHQVAVDSALPEGETRQPVRGHLYFAHRGNLKRFKTIELVVKRGKDEAVVRFR